MLVKIPLLLEPQPEGGFTVTSPLLPELVTEGDTAEEALENVRDALAAVIEAYQDLGSSPSCQHAIGGLQRPHLAGDGAKHSMTYRDAIRKLTILGCQELPRRGGGSTANGSTQERSVLAGLGKP
jgi:antitoxin HicB